MTKESENKNGDDKGQFRESENKKNTITNDRKSNKLTNTAKPHICNENKIWANKKKEQMTKQKAGMTYRVNAKKKKPVEDQFDLPKRAVWMYKSGWLFFLTTKKTKTKRPNDKKV